MLRTRITGDSAAFNQHAATAVELERMPHLAGPLIEIGVSFMQTMIAKGAVDAGQVLEWLDRMESALMAAELEDGGAGD